MSEDNNRNKYIAAFSSFFSIIIFLSLTNIHQYNVPIIELTANTIIFAFVWMILLDIIVLGAILLILLIVGLLYSMLT